MYLHPAALVDVFEQLHALVGPTGQLWLATHSLSVLAILKDEEIWTIESGCIRHPGAEQVERAMTLLIGQEDRSDQFRQLLAAPDQWAATKFVADCLIAPEKVAFADADPQLGLLDTLFTERANAGANLCLMDLGAGRARLATMLQQKGFTDLEYIAVEPDTSLRDLIGDAAGTLLSKRVGILGNVRELPFSHRGNVDIVVLCNVLHEIPPAQWRAEIEFAAKSLRPDGIIVICEDQLMPIGERPHRLGFLLLGLDEIQTLFGLEEMPRRYLHNLSRYRERLLCVAIPGISIKITAASVIESIEQLRQRMKSELTLMRGQEKKWTAHDGRKYGFVSQMMINAELSLEELRQQPTL